MSAEAKSRDRSSRSLDALKRTRLVNKATLFLDVAAVAGEVYLNRKFFGTAVGDNAIYLTLVGAFDSLRSTGNIYDYGYFIEKKKRKHRVQLFLTLKRLQNNFLYFSPIRIA